MSAYEPPYPAWFSDPSPAALCDQYDKARRGEDGLAITPGGRVVKSSVCPVCHYPQDTDGFDCGGEHG